MNLFWKTLLSTAALATLLLLNQSSFAMGPNPPTPPTVTISAEPASVLSAEPVTLSWSSSDATSCTIDNGIGGVELNGSRVVYPATNTTYTINVNGEGGDASDSVSITIKKPAEIISFTVSASSIKEGEPVTLTWETNLADSCSISPAPGSVGTSGSVIVEPDTDTTYTLNAGNSDGSDTESVSIVVIPLLQQTKTFEYDDAGRIKAVISQ